jgi:hypothetical protein
MSTSKQTYTQDAFEKLRAEFEQKEKAMQERIWLDSNVAKFDEVIRLNYSQDTQSFAKAITNYTAETTEALSAVFLSPRQRNHPAQTFGQLCDADRRFAPKASYSWTRAGGAGCRNRQGDFF